MYTSAGPIFIHGVLGPQSGYLRLLFVPSDWKLRVFK